MGDEFYCILKLVSGEEVFSLISIDENDGDPLIILQNPVIMKIINNQKGMYVKIKPWMEIPNDDMYVIRLDKVITMTETKDKNMIFFYNKFLNDHNDDESSFLESDASDGEVKISSKMGYISSVEDARKKLEDLFKNNKES